MSYDAGRCPSDVLRQSFSSRSAASSCEFTSGCEWRTKKAAEAIERQRLLKRHAEAKLRKLDAKRRARLQARTPTPALVGESDSGKEG